ncbi:ATP-binding protein [Streptomyces lunalinharesii]|uniref:AAA+ ATPase domain-containing protein n=1 Tax=Streptomyces lunalinharesii TaxID=333384 RepID=A0ABP6E8L4_9ACTN
MQYDEALRTAIGWLEQAGPSGTVLQVSGPPGAGKTQLLADLGRRFPAAVTVDCRGLTADRVAHAVLAGLGLRMDPSRDREPLRDALARHEGDAVVLLANAQWAGPLFSSREPTRVGGDLTAEIGLRSGGRVSVVVEVDGSHERVAVTRRKDVELAGRPAHEAPVARIVAEHPVLQALAAAETGTVPLAVWAFLAGALGVPATVAELSALAGRLPEIVAQHAADASDSEAVGFCTDGLKHLARRARPLTPDQQQALTTALHTALTDRPPSDEVRAYAAEALAVHAALADALPALLDTARALAHCTRYSLLQALPLHFTEGVPQHGVAADIHYLETDGIAPEGQGEWLAWLHWAATNRGATAWAAALADAGVPLSWRTAWSHHRPYGVLGPVPGETGKVDYLYPGVLDGAGAVAGQRLLPVFQEGDHVPPEGDDQAVERVWRLDDGTEPEPSTVVDLFYDVEGDLESVEGRGRFESTGDAALALDPHTPLRLPRSATASCLVTEGRWVLAGRGGLFAVDTARPEPAAGSDDADHSPHWAPPLIAPHTTAATWEFPTELVTPQGPTPAALARAFGPDACRRLPADAVPAGLDDATRRCLTETGVPVVNGQIYLATLPPLDETGLPTGDWEAEPAVPSPGDGPFHPLGTWIGSGAYLDAATGRIIQDGRSGASFELVVASSLPQYLALLCLYRTFQISPFATTAEHRDAARSLTQWASRIDPVVADSDMWDAVLSGSMESDLIVSGWDLPGLRPA